MPQARSNWFGMPKKGAERISYRDVRTMAGGKPFTATYHQTDGKLFVDSAWGSRVEPIGNTKDVPKRAAQLLGHIVVEYLAQHY